MASDRLLVNTTGIEQAITGLQHVEYEIERAAYLLSRIDLTESIGLQAYDEVLEIYTKQLKNQSRKVESLAAKTQQVLDKFVATENDLANPKDVDFPTLGAVVSGDDGVIRETNENGVTKETYQDGTIIWKYLDGSKSIQVPYVLSDGTTGYLQDDYNADGELTKRVDVRKSKYYGEYWIWYEVEDGKTVGRDTTNLLADFSETKRKERTYELAENDQIWQAKQNAQIIESQKELFHNEFNEDRWLDCKNNEEQDRYLSELHREVCEIYGIDSDEVELEIIHAKDKYSKVETLAEEEKGYYQYEQNKKRMVIRVSPDKTYDEIASSVVHETSHQFQHELLNDDNIRREYIDNNLIDDQYLNDLELAFDNTINAKTEYKDNDKAKEFYTEAVRMGIPKDRAEMAANIYLNMLYRDQPFEVDAFRTEYEIQNEIIKIREDRIREENRRDREIERLRSC